MKFTRNEDHTIANIKIDNEEIENVSEFRYIGALVNSDERDTKEMKSRIGMVKQASIINNVVFKNTKLNLKLRKEILHGYIWPIMQYSCKSCTMTADYEKRADSFEVWCYHRIFKNIVHQLY